MEIKVYSIKLNTPRWLRHLVVYGLLPIGALLGAAGAVRAGVTLTTFAAGTAIKAADVNTNFTNLNAAVTALQGKVPIVTGWQTYVPVVTGDSGATIGNQTTTGVYRRVGDSLEVGVDTLFSAAPASGATFYQWSLPNGFTIDYARTVLPTGRGATLVGGGITGLGPNHNFVLIPYAQSTTTVSATANGADIYRINDSVPFAFGNGANISFNFLVPITGWTATQ